jgi:hypothetical protein
VTEPAAPVLEIPQADNLARVRLVAAAVAEGQRGADIARRLGVTERNVAYAAQAARALLLLVGNTLAPLGAELLATAPGSEGERVCFRKAIAASPALAAVAPALLAETPPDASALAARIAEVSGLGAATAERRAQALLSWRQQVVSPQGLLFG